MEQRNKLDKSVKQNIDYELIEKETRKADDMANRYLLKKGVSQKAIDIMKKSIIELELFGVTLVDKKGKE